MAYELPSISALADDIAASLSVADEDEARRLAFYFIEVYDAAAAGERDALIRNEPRATGDQRFDALLAALVEFVCTRQGTPAPTWVEDPGRFLERWWFVSDMPAFHAEAIVHSPISFARRGVFVTQHALSYV
jgi:hypothetical protein